MGYWILEFSLIMVWYIWKIISYGVRKPYCKYGIIEAQNGSFTSLWLPGDLVTEVKLELE